MKVPWIVTNTQLYLLWAEQEESHAGYHWKCSTTKATRCGPNQLWQLCRGCGTFPPALPVHPRLHQPAAVWGEGSWGAKQVPACRQGLHFQLHSYTVELQKFLPRCVQPEGNNCMKADMLCCFSFHYLTHVGSVMLLWAGLGSIHMAICTVGECELWHGSHGAQQWAWSVCPTLTWPGDHHCSAVVGKAATAWQGMGTLNCAVGGSLSQFFRFFPQHGTALLEQVDRQPERVNLSPSRYGWTPRYRESFYHQYVSVRSPTQKGTLVGFMPPPSTTVACECVSKCIQELSCLLCSTRNVSGRDILPGNTSVKDILLDRLDHRGL